MIIRLMCLFVVTTLLFIPENESMANDSEFSGDIELLYTNYINSPKFPDQVSSSHGIRGRLLYKTDVGNAGKFNLEGSCYYSDENSEKQLCDLSKFNIVQQISNTELLLGASVESTGSALIRSVLDPINTVDYIEDPINGKKLGQPMFRLEQLWDSSELAVYALPYHRAQNFVGESGRLRIDPPISGDDATYDPGHDENDVSYAARYVYHLNSMDFGAVYFKGNARSAYFSFGEEGGRYFPHYPYIELYGLDAQIVSGDWLFAGEIGIEEAFSQTKHPFTLSAEYSSFFGEKELIFQGQYSYSSNAIRTIENRYVKQADVSFTLKPNDIYDSEIKFQLGYNLDESSISYISIPWSMKFSENSRVTLNYVDIKDSVAPQELSESLSFSQDDYIFLSFKLSF